MSFFSNLRKQLEQARIPNLDMGRREREMRDRAYRPPTTDMGLNRGGAMSSILEQLRKKNEINYGSKLESEQRMNQPFRRPVDVQQTPISNMPDWMKPRFRINSLDRQNNDPLKTGSLDSFKGNTDVKPIPSATFSGSVSKIPNLTLQ
jgi:hypothetical protein